MRLAVIDGVGFAAAVGDTWFSLESMGVEARTTRDAILQREQISERLHDENRTGLGRDSRLMCPIIAPGKIIAIGLNYMDHVRETGATMPTEPVVFTKFSSALTGPSDPILLDTSATQAADYECELAVVIGAPLRNASVSDALGGVFGYCVANDVSARDLQANDPRISRAKSLDTFCPMGPWITTRDQVSDPQRLSIRAIVNGEPRQESNTEQMIFSVARLIEYLSRGTTLEPGDIILTGTPPGVGFARKPPTYLRKGDVVVCEVEGLGRLENWVDVAA